jgi:hypothetical protein
LTPDAIDLRCADQNSLIETEDDREIVLGRNALNQLILLLDGPNQQMDILDRRPV